MKKKLFHFQHMLLWSDKLSLHQLMIGNKIKNNWHVGLMRVEYNGLWTTRIINDNYLYIGVQI